MRPTLHLSIFTKSYEVLVWLHVQDHSNLCLLRSKVIFMDIPEIDSEKWLIFSYLCPLSRETVILSASTVYLLMQYCKFVKSVVRETRILFSFQVSFDYIILCYYLNDIVSKNKIKWHFDSSKGICQLYYFSINHTLFQ